MNTKILNRFYLMHKPNVSSRDTVPKKYIFLFEKNTMCYNITAISQPPPSYHAYYCVLENGRDRFVLWENDTMSIYTCPKLEYTLL